MDKKIKIFGLSVEFGNSIPNFEKIDKLIVQAGKHIVLAKKNFIEFSKEADNHNPGGYKYRSFYNKCVSNC